MKGKKSQNRVYFLRIMIEMHKNEELRTNERVEETKRENWLMEKSQQDLFL